MITATQIIREYAESKGWKVAIVDDRSVSFELSKIDLTGGDIVCLISKSAPVPVFEDVYYSGNMKQSIRVFVGRKMEQISVSSVSETYAQKYDARLSEIEQLVYWFIVHLNCRDGVLSMTADSVLPVTNMFAANLDGIEFGLSFVFNAVYYE